MAAQGPASFPHLGLLEAELASTDYPGPLPHIGALLTGADPVLTADYDTYVITGQNAGLTATRRLTAEYGAYAVSGQSAVGGTARLSPAPLPHLSLLEGLGGSTYTLTAEYGSYSITGQSAGLLRALSLPANIGYIALYGQVGLLTVSANSSGESVPLPHLATLFIPTYTNRTLTADPGVYAYTGSAALADFELDADTNTYSLTGQDVWLTSQFRLTAEYGSYSVSGQDAGSSIGGSALTMTADGGTYSLSGNDAGLYAGLGFTAEHGFYGLLGQVAVVSVGVSGITTLTAEYGIYAITGVEAEFAGGVVPPVVVDSPVVGGYWPEPWLPKKKKKREEQEAEVVAKIVAPAVELKRPVISVRTKPKTVAAPVVQESLDQKLERIAKARAKKREQKKREMEEKLLMMD